MITIETITGSKYVGHRSVDYPDMFGVFTQLFSNENDDSSYVLIANKHIVARRVVG